MSLDQENSNRTDQTPHSGNLPEGLRENPVNPDGTPLRDDLSTPDTIEDLAGGYVPGAAAEADAKRTDTTGNKETPRKWFTKKAAAITLAATLVTGAAVTTAVVANSQAQTVVDPAPGEEDPILPPEDEGEVEVEEPTTPEAPVTPPVPERLEYGLTDADVAGFLGESQSAFLSRAPEERATLIMYYAQNLPEFAEEYYKVSKNSKDELSGNIVNPENMTPEEILTFQNYLHRMTITLTNSADGNFALDQNAANKAIAAQLINGNQSSYYNSWTANVQEWVDFGGAAQSARSLAASNTAPVPKLNSASDRFTDEAGRTCVTLNVTTADGATADATMCLVVTANGSIWLAK